MIIFVILLGIFLIVAGFIALVAKPTPYYENTEVMVRSKYEKLKEAGEFE